MSTSTTSDDKYSSKPGGAHSPKPDKDKPKKSEGTKDTGPSKSKGPAKK